MAKKKASDLTKVTYKDNLQVVVSDPDVPAGPGKQSYRVDASDIRPKTFDWNPSTTAISAVTNAKNGDYLKVTGIVDPVLYGGFILALDDQVFITNKAGNGFIHLPKKTSTGRKVTLLTSAQSPYAASLNEDIYYDLTDGPITVTMNGPVRSGDYTTFAQLAGDATVNNLTLNSTNKFAGLVDPIVVSENNAAFKAQWVNVDYGYAFAKI